MSFLRFDDEYNAQNLEYSPEQNIEKECSSDETVLPENDISGKSTIDISSNNCCKYSNCYVCYVSVHSIGRTHRKIIPLLVMNNDGLINSIVLNAVTVIKSITRVANSSSIRVCIIKNGEQIFRKYKRRKVRHMSPNAGIHFRSFIEECEKVRYKNMRS